MVGRTLKAEQAARCLCSVLKVICSVKKQSYTRQKTKAESVNLPLSIFAHTTLYKCCLCHDSTSLISLLFVTTLIRKNEKILLQYFIQ